MQDLRGPLSPTITQPPPRPFSDVLKAPDRPDLLRRTSGQGSSTSKMTSSLRLATPMGVRARLNSLGYDSGTRQSKASSSSTVTIQGIAQIPRSPLKSTASSPDHSETESDEEADKAEEEERRLEEQDALDKKLKHLQTVMTSDALGLVRDTRPKNKGKVIERGRDGLKSPTSPSPLRQIVQRRDVSSSDYNSSTSSPQGSIPSIPSPSSESQPHSPLSRRHSHANKSSSPPAVSGGHARGQSHLQYRPMMGGAIASDRGSNQGSSASSFSDISGGCLNSRSGFEALIIYVLPETSLSASALESALLSNIRGGGSRL